MKEPSFRFETYESLFRLLFSVVELAKGKLNDELVKLYSKLYQRTLEEVKNICEKNIILINMFTKCKQQREIVYSYLANKNEEVSSAMTNILFFANNSESPKSAPAKINANDNKIFSIFFYLRSILPKFYPKHADDIEESFFAGPEEKDTPEAKLPRLLQNNVAAIPYYAYFDGVLIKR